MTIRAENPFAISLKMSGETICESLLIAIFVNGLLLDLKPFKTVIIEKEKYNSKFKVTLRSFEEAEKIRGKSSTMRRERKWQN